MRCACPSDGFPDSRPTVAGVGALFPVLMGHRARTLRRGAWSGRPSLRPARLIGVRGPVGRLSTCAPATWLDQSLPQFPALWQVSYQFQAEGSGTLVFEVVDGVLPPGLELSESGLLSGSTDVDPTSWPVTIRVSNECGSDDAEFVVEVT